MIMEIWWRKCDRTGVSKMTGVRPAVSGVAGASDCVPSSEWLSEERRHSDPAQKGSITPQVDSYSIWHSTRLNGINFESLGCRN